MSRCFLPAQGNAWSSSKSRSGMEHYFMCAIFDHGSTGIHSKGKNWYVTRKFNVDFDDLFEYTLDYKGIQKSQYLLLRIKILRQDTDPGFDAWNRCKEEEL